jgi:fructose-1,6-bisphosphatase I
MIIEQAGGKALTASTTPVSSIMDIKPTAIHQRTSVILGSADEVDAVVRHL